MGAAADKLTALVADPERFAFSAEELRETQVAALDERFQDRKDRIKLLNLRARDAGLESIRSISDIVPVLFPHTAYKSYPESFLMEERWDRLTKWLGTISPYPIEGVSLDGIDGIDGVGRRGVGAVLAALVRRSSLVCNGHRLRPRVAPGQSQ